MGIVNLPSYGSDPATVNASNLDGKVDPLATEFNGNIENVNIAAGAAIAASKLNLSSIAQDIAMSSSQILWAKGADVASATSIALGTDGNAFDITGTTTIQTITAKQAGSVVLLHFDGALTLTDDTGNLELQGNDLQVNAEDEVILKCDGTNWHLVSYSSANRYLLKESASAPSTGASQGALYTKDTGGQPELFYREESDGDEVQITSGGVLNSGAIVQVKSTLDQTERAISVTTTFPVDDTKPQSSEGGAYSQLDTAITPTNASNKLIVEGVVTLRGTGTGNGEKVFVALFKDSETDARSLAVNNLGDNSSSYKVATVPIYYEMTAGGTSEITFKIRVSGSSSSSTVYANAMESGTVNFGNIMCSSVKITEVVP